MYPQLKRKIISGQTFERVQEFHSACSYCSDVTLECAVEVPITAL